MRNARITPRQERPSQGGYYPYFIPLTENEGTEAVFRGHRLIMCGSNNYLGLTTHPKVRQAALDAIQRYGTSCTGSRFLNGTIELHEQLEREMAEWVGKEAALVFSTGMQTNLGTISALVSRDDVVILDKQDHASIVDGAKLSWGKTVRFRHNDMADLERVLRGCRGSRQTGGGGWAVQHGRRHCPSSRDHPALQEIRCPPDGGRCPRDRCPGRGRGTAAHFNLTGEVDLIMSTFSKSFASLGGFIAGDDDIIHYIKHHARAMIFSASIPPANAAAALAALHVMQAEPERIQRVNDIAAHMRKEYLRLGFDIGKSETPIIPILIGDDMRTLAIWKALFDAGVFVNPVIAPAVPEGRQLLRTSYMATHTDEQMSRVLETFEKVGKQVGLIS